MTNAYIKGRGAQHIVPNKFESHHIEYEDFIAAEQSEEGIKTQYIHQTPKQIVNQVNSPDLGFDYSLNPYQGCEHGCIYCYARNSHEYWGYNSGIDFESKIVVKDNAAELLEQYLLKKKDEVKPIVLSGNTDCYQPIERKFGLTRKLLEVFAKYRHPVSIITKNSLVMRDLDILKDLAGDNLVHVMLSMTSLDESLRRMLEPRTSSSVNKLKAVKQLAENGISVGTMLAPIIPGINHHEIPQLLKESAAHGARLSTYAVVRLNGNIGMLFKDWLIKNYPDRYDKVINQIEALHDGKLNDTEYGRRMRGEGPYATIIKQLFNMSYKQYFPKRDQKFALNSKAFRRGGHYKLFG